jgi:hypothetical protein
MSYLFCPLLRGGGCFMLEILIQQIVVSTPIATHKQIRQLIDTVGLADHFGSFFMKV